MFYTIASMIMLALMIIILLVFARTSATKKNNLFLIFLIGIGLLALTTYNIIYPHWWMVIVMAIIMVSLFFVLENDQKQLIKKKAIPANCERKEVNSTLYITISNLLISVGIFGLAEGYKFWWSLLILGGVAMIVIYVWSVVKNI